MYRAFVVRVSVSVCVPLSLCIGPAAHLQLRRCPSVCRHPRVLLPGMLASGRLKRVTCYALLPSSSSGEMVVMIYILTPLVLGAALHGVGTLR